MSAEEIRSRTQQVWDNFYSFGSIWKRSRFIKSSRGRLAFLLISKIYRQMYADTGIATDSARVSRSGRWVRLAGQALPSLFAGRADAESSSAGGIKFVAGMHSPWVRRLLSGLGHEVIVAMRVTCG